MSSDVNNPHKEQATVSGCDSLALKRRILYHPSRQGIPRNPVALGFVPPTKAQKKTMAIPAVQPIEPLVGFLQNISTASRQNCRASMMD